MNNASLLSPQDLQSAIIRNLVKISPYTTVKTAIAMMGEMGESFALVLDNIDTNSIDPNGINTKHHALIGIMTERDIIRFSIQSISLDKIPIQAVMSHPVITIQASTLDDLKAVMTLFHQHQVRYLPVLDGDRLIGVLAKDLLTEILTQTVLNLQDLQQVGTANSEIERRYATLAAAAPVAIFKFDEIFNCTYVNDRWSEMTGRSKESALGQGWMEALHPDDHNELIAQWRQDYTQDDLSVRVIIHSEGRHLRPDGVINWFYVQVVPEIDTDGCVVGYIGTLTDITARKEAELALQKSEQRYRALMDGASDAIFLADIQGNGIAANQQAEFLLGYSQEELMHLHMSQVHPPESLEAVREHFQGVIQHNLATNLETFVIRKDGNQIPVDITAKLIELEDEQIVQAIFRDISDRKHSEEILQLSEELFRSAFDNTVIGMSLISLEGRFIRVNAAICNFLGYSEAELLQLTFQELTHPDDLANSAEIAQSLISGTIHNHSFEKRYITKTGQAIWSLVSVSIVKDIHIQPLYIVAQIQDISVRKQAEIQLRESEIRFRRVFESSVVGMLFADFQGHIIEANDRFLEMIGYTREELLSGLIHWDDLTPAEHISNDLLAMEHLKKHGVINPWEKEYYRKDGSRVAVLIGAALLPDTEDQTICIVMDISDRKKADAVLAQYTNEVEDLYNNAPCGYHSLDPNGRYIRVNETELQWLGYKREEMIGQPLIKFFTEDSCQAFFRNYQVFLAQGAIKNAEYDMICKDGSILPVMISATAVKDGHDNYLYNRATMVDIRDRKQAEQALQKSQRFIQQIADASPNILYLYDIQEQRNVYTNREIFSILGYSPQEIQAMGANFTLELLHPDDLQVILPAYYERIKAAEDGEIIDTEYRMRHANGEWCWLYSRDSVFSRDAEGKVKQTIGTAQDITDRKQLEQSQNRLRSMLESATDYILIAELSGKTIWINTALKKLRELRDDQVPQQMLMGYHPQWVVDLLEQQAIPTAIANGSWMGETALLDMQGGEIPVSQLLIAHQSPQGEMEFFSTIMRDMRVQKEYEQRLERTNAELLRATQLKDEFLATMSHELRTPLNAILGMTESLQEQVFGVVNEQQIQALQTVESSGNYLLELINDILDVAKIEAGQIELNYEPVSISDLCQSSLAFIRQQASQKQIQLEVKIPILSSKILVDERRIRQVLINLLNNAVKFTPQAGRVTLEVNTQADQASAEANAWIQFSIIDTGIGISPEKISKLFQPFVQIDSALNRKYTGTGLGLALAKRIVELHGGRVQLTSEVDKGSCFDIVIPYNKPHQRSVSEAYPQPNLDIVEIPPILAPVILVVEDNEANISTISNYLEAKGYHLLLARDGLEAIAMTTTHNPDLILMDIQMPNMDGLEATRQIRRDPNLANIPIIALTALAMTGDREKCLEAGANDYIIKPVKLKQLHTIIQQLLA